MASTSVTATPPVTSFWNAYALPAKFSGQLSNFRLTSPSSFSTSSCSKSRASGNMVFRRHRLFASR